MRRKTEAEKIAIATIKRGEGEVREKLGKVEVIVPSWVGEEIILDVRADEEWSRHRFFPRDTIDTLIMAQARGV